MKKANSNNYFADCVTEEQVKERFHKLAKELHPDNGGSAKEFVAMKNAFEKAFAQYKGIHHTRDGKEYTKETKYTAKGFEEMIEKLIHLKDCTVEIIGSWVWVTGNTKVYREELKAMKFYFSNSKKAWYYNGDPYSKRRGQYTMKQLRNMWGTQTFEQETPPELK